LKILRLDYSAYHYVIPTVTFIDLIKNSAAWI